MEDPEESATDDGPNLKGSDRVQDGFTLAGEDVEHVAHQDPRLRADSRPPEAE